MRWKEIFFDSIAHRIFWAVSISFSICWSAIYLRNFEVAQQDFGDLDVLTEHVASGWKSALADQESVRAVQMHADTLNSFMESSVSASPHPPGLFKVHVRDVNHRSIYLNPAAQKGPGCDPAVTSGFFDCVTVTQPLRGYRAQTALWTIDVYASREDRAQSFLNDVWTWSSFEPFLIAFPLILIPVWLALVIGLRPLQRLRKKLLARSPHDISPLPLQGLPKEVRPFIEALNVTLERLDVMRQRERAFLADAAHEIRTPLALIQAQIDVMEHGRTPADREQGMQRLRQGLARASRLVNQLLCLARLEAEHEHKNVVETDLTRSLQELVGSFDAHATQKGVALRLNAPEQAIAKVQLEAVESIVQNLVGNALRHTSAGSVEVDFYSEDSHWILRVSDEGPGIPPALRQRVFDRFYRCGPEGAGAGLGLSIVAAAAQSMGGDVFLTSSNPRGQGLCATVRWPVEIDSRPASAA